MESHPTESKLIAVDKPVAPPSRSNRAEVYANREERIDGERALLGVQSFSKRLDILSMKAQPPANNSPALDTHNPKSQPSDGINR